MRAWQVPISSHNHCAHYFEQSTRTNRVAYALCQAFFNPGFAEPMQPEDHHCRNCWLRYLTMTKEMTCE